MFIYANILTKVLTFEYIIINLIIYNYFQTKTTHISVSVIQNIVVQV